MCARTTVNSFVRVEVEDLVGEPIDWEIVWQLSKAQGVAPLVYRTLSAICPAAVPVTVHDAFRRHLQLNALLHTVLDKELMAVLNVLTAKGIRVIPLNGLSLASMAYGDPSLRECTALDLIVDKEAIPQASQVLWSQGYQLITSDKEDGSETEEAPHCFRKRSGVIAVNLQWTMARRHFSFR
ncbi:MAG TPA: nucleotidyltransferase family protein, partial [Nitrospira sp.]|nr:nucleotidyltransferase family protein [Nitrospira sp.]